MRKIFIIIVSLIYLLNGCSSTMNKKSPKTNLELAEEAVNNASVCFSNGNIEEAHKYIDLTGFSDIVESELNGGDEFLDMWLSLVRFEVISSEEIDSKRVKVNLKVTAPSHNSVFTTQQNLLDAKVNENFNMLMYMSETKREEWVRLTIKECNRIAYYERQHPLVTTETACFVNNIDGNWIVSTENDYMIDAMLGAFIQACEDVLGLEVITENR